MVFTWPAYNSRNWDVELKGYIDQITVSLATYANASQLAGTSDITSALQAAGDALMDIQGSPFAAGGGRLIVPAGSKLWFDGSAYVHAEHWQNITLDLAGGTTFKTNNSGSYVLFRDEGLGAGYGSSAKRLTFENGYFVGSFSTSTPANLCVFAGNHSQQIAFRNCEFVACQLEAGHTFDLAGCDQILFENCIWRGYRNVAGTAPRAEAINTDVSAYGTGAPEPPYCDGLPCRNITVRNCQFLPWTDPANGTKWPAPNPIGGHTAVEGKPMRNIVCDNIYLEDPVKDPAGTGNFGENPYIRGMFHFVAVQGLRIKARVVATDNLGCSRIVQAQSTSVGIAAGTDFNSSGINLSAPFTTPDKLQDVQIDIDAQGFLGTDSTLNPQIYVGGVTNGYGENVRINLQSRGQTRENVLAYKINNLDLYVAEMVSSWGSARLISCNGVTYRGNLRNCQYPVVLDGCKVAAVGPGTVQNDTQQGRVVATSGSTAGVSDYVSIVGITAKNVAALTSGTAPTNMTQAGNVVTAS